MPDGLDGMESQKWESRRAGENEERVVGREGVTGLEEE